MHLNHPFLAAALAFTGLLAATAPATSQDLESPQSGKDVGPPDTSGARYEGYLFLDADGHPLPFQSDEGIESYLGSSTVVSVTKIPVGITRPTKVLLGGEALRLHAVFKNIDEELRNVRDPTTSGRGKLYLIWRDSYVFDVAAYRVDRLLGLDRMAPVIVRKLRGDTGSLQIWIEGTITEKERRQGGFEPPEIARFNQQLGTLRIFDNLVANRDANLGNILIDGNWRLWFIDCSRCFGTSDDLLYPDRITHCERRMWKALNELELDTARQALDPYLGKGEIEALLKRRDKIVALLQKRIDEWGEDLVLFDQRPPTDTAPWVDE
jgi:hypothetical protein